jgi:hypothetical protein
LTAADGDSIQVLELELAGDDDTDVPFPLGALPEPVRQALQSRFPSAEPIEAAITDEQGATEYDIHAEFSGQIIGLTVTPDGQILEIENTVAASELPPQVLDWVRQNYPDAAIDEAAIVTNGASQSYEVLLESAGQEIEATLQLQDTPSARNSGDGDPTRPSDPPTPDPNSGSAVVDDGAPGGMIASEAQLPAQASGGADSRTLEPLAQQSAARSAPVGQPRADSRKQLATAIPELLSSQASLLLNAVHALDAAGAGALLPQVAEVLSDVVPIELAAVELGLQRIVAQIDSLAEQVPREMELGRNAVSLAVMGVLLAGALLLLETRKSGAGPMVVFHAVNSSWSWVLGTKRCRKPRGFRAGGEP